MESTSNRKKTISLYDIYEEKREYPRVSLNALAALGLPDGFDVNVIVHDISPDGVQLRCNRKTAHMIHPSGKFITGATAPGATLKFSLNVENREREVQVLIRLFYFTIISTDTVAFGAKFEKFEKFSGQFVEKFISQAMTPVEEKVLDLLDKPRSEDYIVEQIGESTVNLDDTLNLLKKKKAIITYGKDRKKKYIRLEAALESILKRIDKIERKISLMERKLQDSETGKEQRSGK
ncbi:MAG: hypothetical protein R3318_02405 [Gammaproteobacteria bacterium]|nr:hypothetical protein [Gammaproteobacteria bacterium]